MNESERFERFYKEMKSLVDKYNTWALEIDSKVPSRWYLMGIQELLRGFESEEIPKLGEDMQVIMRKDLENEKIRLESTKELLISRGVRI